MQTSRLLSLAVLLAAAGCGRDEDSPADASVRPSLDLQAPAPPDLRPSIPAAYCNAEPDCQGGTICQMCDHRCVYPPNGRCDSRAPCPCDYACVNQTCTANAGTPAASCVRDADCPIDHFCNRAVYQCQSPMYVTGDPSRDASTAPPCKINADCPDGSICSTADGVPACLLDETFTCHTALECRGGGACDENHQCRPGFC